MTLATVAAARADVPGPPAHPVPPALETVVTVRALPATVPREDKAAAASVILPEDSPRAYDDLGSLLLEVPGVTVTRTGAIGAFTTLSLRGSNPDEVRIYVDGVPLAIAAGGAVDISTLPLGDVERVEVYRGTTPLGFAESALGGIVSITTRTPGTSLLTGRAGVGSFGTTFGDAAIGGRLGRVRLYLGAHVLSTVGDYPYLNDNRTPLNPTDDVYGPRQNNDVVQADGVFRAALTLSGRRTLGLGLVAFTRDQGLPGPGGDPTTFARFKTDRALGNVHYESRDDLGPGGRLSVAIFAVEQRDHLDDAGDELGLGGRALRHDTTRSQGVSAFGTRPFGDTVRGSLILEGRHETYAPEDDLAAVPVGAEGRRVVGVAGTELDLHWPKLDLDLIPSLRVEAMNDLVSARDPITGAPAPSIGRRLPVWRLGLVRPLGAGATLKANLGRYARAPSFLELYGNGTSRLLGNPTLLAEDGINADLGLSVSRGGERLATESRTTVFGARVDDLIQWDYASWGQARAENLGRARIWGLEEEVRLAVGRQLRLCGQWTYLVALDVSDNVTTSGLQIPFHPRHHVYARPELVRIPLPAGLELAAYLDGDLRAESWSDSVHLQPAYTRFLAGAGLTLASPREHLRLTASAANLTDSRRVDVSLWSLPGRSVFLALAYAPVDPVYGP